MRVAILTSLERGFPSLAIDALVRGGIEIAVVVRAEAGVATRRARLRQVLRKVRRIGLLGAINGLRMRRWYGADVEAVLPTEPVAELCARLRIALRTVRAVNDPEVAAALAASGASLGLSLGNAWIAPPTFESLAEGFVNVHHELLPERRGAQAVIWSLFEGRRTTGYTIHRVDRAIDGGAIVERVERPILFRGSLRETVAATYADLLSHSAARLSDVCARWSELSGAATPQGPGRRRTTPTWAEFRKIRAEWVRLAHGAAP
ncbi:MAG TPA: formyltransferase family protein [Phycisphaerales bacterium]|nr:formyltransferase family protein [Phycisphaerales bacterium]HMP38549.1 formyltransferase family protein [Phycisphaerales bacterium]